MPSDAMFTEVIELSAKVDKFERGIKDMLRIYEDMRDQIDKKPIELLSESQVKFTVTALLEQRKILEQNATLLEKTVNLAIAEATTKQRVVQQYATLKNEQQSNARHEEENQKRIAALREDIIARSAKAAVAAEAKIRNAQEANIREVEAARIASEKRIAALREDIIARSTPHPDQGRTSSFDLNRALVAKYGMLPGTTSAYNIADAKARGTLSHLVGSRANVGTTIDAAASMAFMGGMGNVGAGLYMLERLAYASGVGRKSLMELGESVGLVAKGASKSDVAVAAFGRSLLTLAPTIVGAVTAIVTVGAALAKGVETDRLTARLESLMGFDPGTSRSDRRAIRNSVQRQLSKVGSEAGYSVETQLDASYQALSSGIDQKDLAAFMAQVNPLARATGVSPKEAVAAITTIFNAYEKGMYSAAEASDILFKTVDIGGAEIKELLHSVGKVGSTAAAVGLDLKTLGSWYAVITSGGVGADVAGTRINRLLMDAIAPRPQAREAFKRYGITTPESFDNAPDKAMNFIYDVRERTGGDPRALAELFPDERGRSAIQKLVDSAPIVAAAYKEIATSAGATAAAAAAVNDSWDGFTNSLSATAGNAFKDFGKGLLEAIGSVTGMYGPLSAQTGGLITTVIHAIDAVVTPVLTSVFAIIGSIAKAIEGVVYGVYGFVKEILAMIVGMEAAISRALEGVIRSIPGLRNTDIDDKVSLWAQEATNRAVTVHESAITSFKDAGASFAAIGDRMKAWVDAMAQLGKRLGIASETKVPSNPSPLAKSNDKQSLEGGDPDPSGKELQAAKKVADARMALDKQVYDNWLYLHNQRDKALEALTDKLEKITEMFRKMRNDTADFFTPRNGTWRQQRDKNEAMIQELKNTTDPARAKELHDKILEGINQEESGMKREYGYDDRTVQHRTRSRYEAAIRSAEDASQAASTGVITNAQQAVRKKQQQDDADIAASGNTHYKGWQEATKLGIVEGLKDAKFVTELHSAVGVKIDAIAPERLTDVVKKVVQKEYERIIEEIIKGKAPPPNTPPKGTPTTATQGPPPSPNGVSKKNVPITYIDMNATL